MGEVQDISRKVMVVGQLCMLFPDIPAFASIQF
jgi:hypothetical protein